MPNRPTLPPLDAPWPPDTVRAVRAYLGLSSRELAEALELGDGRRVREWQSGQRKPSTLAKYRMGQLVERHEAAQP